MYNNEASGSLTSSDDGSESECETVWNLQQANVARLAADRSRQRAAQQQMAELHAYQCALDQ